VVAEPTCGSGLMQATCTICGENKYKLTDPDPDHVCEFSDWETTGTGAACDTNNAKTRYCKIGKAEYENIRRVAGYKAQEFLDYNLSRQSYAVEIEAIEPTAEHAWVLQESSQPYPCKDGEAQYTCSQCGATKTEAIKATAEHQWGEWEELEWIDGRSFLNASDCWDTRNVRYCSVCDARQYDKTMEEIIHHVGPFTVYTPSCSSYIWSLVDENDPSTILAYQVLCRHCYDGGFGYYYYWDKTIYYLGDTDGNPYIAEDGRFYLIDANPYVCYDSSNHGDNVVTINAAAATATENGYTGDLYCTYCDTLIESGEIIYAVLNGADSTWVTGSDSGLSIRSNADISKFVSVLINGEELARKYYSVTAGSTIITISEEYLSTLKDGEYTIEIVSTDGSATTTFTVTGAAAAPTDTKKEESTGSTETKKDETTVSTDTKKDTTKTDTKSDSATSTNPKTGDESSLVLWVSALGISFAALALLAVLNQKRYTGKRVK
jgi:hypothetical protein